MSWADDVDLDFDFGYGSGPLAASPTWVDKSTYIRMTTITRGRSSVTQTFSAGTTTAQANNRDGEFDPGNTSATNQLGIGTPVRIQATHGVTTYDLFRGHVSRVPLSYPEGETGDATATVEIIENTGILRSTRLSEQSYSEESTDTRVDNILDDASWPAGARDLDTGVASAAGITFTGNAGELIDATAEAEQGQFFIAKNGDATFHNRTAQSSVSSAATFNPASNLGYDDPVEVVWDTDLIINKAEVTGATGDPQTASDATSIDDHGEAAYDSANESIVGAPAALNVAEWIVAKYKDVAPRLPSGLRIYPQKDPANLWPEVLGRELRDVITVVFDPPGSGDTLSRDFAIEGIQHEITAGLWVTTYNIHPLAAFETADYWILGTSDDLGTDTVLA